VPEQKVCAACGRRVWADDRYCPGCGIAFGGATERPERRADLPGFNYHFIQGIGWGLGLAAAGAILSMFTLVLIGWRRTAFADGRVDASSWQPHRWPSPCDEAAVPEPSG
jgi:hypothetical protein